MSDRCLDCNMDLYVSKGKREFKREHHKPESTSGASMRRMINMSGGWHEERPGLIDGTGWTLNSERYYPNYRSVSTKITRTIALCIIEFCVDQC